jgi:cytoskeletal protein RodZ
MTIQKSINLALVAFVATLGVALMLVVISVSAQEGDIEEITPVTTQTEESTEEESSESDITEETTEESATTSNFDYVAQPGDSYSLMARKAVQIIFVETNLTLAAGSPVLNLGQQVSIDGNLVSEWIEKAQALTEEQQAEWQPYVDRANFNTNSVGEATE